MARKVVDAPPSETLKVQLERTLRNLIYLKVSLVRAGG